MPVVEPPRNSKQPPPPPPKDESSVEARSPRQKQSANDLSVKSRSAPGGDKVALPRVENGAPPVIGKLDGLEEVNKGFDLGLGGPVGQEEEKPPAWL
jgi:hypothetical protein